MADSCKVTEEQLKQISGEFSLESIFILNLSGRGLSFLASITECLNLCMLDLSSNNLSSVSELAVLTALEHLDLSNNNIVELDGLSKLENLSRLKLAGNKICRHPLISFDTLLPLASLCKLKHLTLQDSTSSTQLTNPVCSDPTYNAVMSETFPTLLWLDREVVKDGMMGKEFYSECRKVKEKNDLVELQDVKQRPKLPSTSGDDPLEIISKLDDNEKIINLLAECSETSSRVQKHINDIRSELAAESRKWTET